MALELEAAAVLDDRNARRAAKTFGVPITGALGLVARARQRDVIPAAETVLRAVIGAGLH